MTTIRIINYIKSKMDFDSFFDFYDRAEYIKSCYTNNDYEVNMLYRWYVYSRDISNYSKMIIWEYLNSDITHEELMEKYKHKKSRKDVKNGYYQD